MKRSVRVISSVGTKLQTIETSAQTWGELKSELADRYPVSGVKAYIAETLNNVEQDGAKLPVTGFTLYLTPTKTESGANFSGAGYKVLREEIKRLKDTLSATDFKAAFGNYTQLSTPELEKLVVAYHSKGSKTTSSVSTAIPTKIAEVVKAVKEVKEVVAIPALSSAEVLTISMAIPVSSIPEGTYVVPFNEEQALSGAKALKMKV